MTKSEIQARIEKVESELATLKADLAKCDPDSEISRARTEIEAMQRDAELWQKHGPVIRQMLAALDTLSPLVLTRLKLQDAAMDGAST